MKSTRLFLAIVLVFTASRLTCQNPNNDTLSQSSVQLLPVPTESESEAPNLTTASDGKIHLSWIETREENRHLLQYSILRDTDWSPAKTIAEGNDWFVNWADFPSLRVLNNGTLAAHWLAKTGDETYAYAVNISFSSKGGTNWSKPVVPHTDGTPTEHGFVSLLPWEKDRVLAVWLDGRDHWYKRQSNNAAETEHGVTSLRSAVIDMNGNLSDEAELDARVCDCCQTGAGLTPEGALVAYRDRSDTEIRDIAIVRFENGRWSPPETLFNDGWEISGCPVNGPSVATQENEVAVAWYTAAHDTAKVKINFSNDGGKTFGKPMRVDDGNPMGRVSALLLPDGTALVCWMETVASGAEVRVRRVQSDGSTGKSIIVTPTSATRASGFPRMACNGTEVVFAWTEASEKHRVLTARMSLAALNKSHDAE